MDLERLGIVLKAKRDHGIKNIFAADSFTLLELTFLSGLARDEANEFGDAFLHALLRVLRNLRCRRHGRLHDTRNICNLRPSQT